MSTIESSDIRKALDKLQTAFEALGDRYRDIRRERKMLRERIDELIAERENSTVSTAVDLEIAANDRKRVVELEERALRAERKHESLFNTISELEERIQLREASMVEQEDVIAQLRAQVEKTKLGSEGIWTEREGLRAQVDELRGELTTAEQRSSELQKRLDELESSTPDAAELEGLRRALAEQRALAEHLRKERSDLDEKNLQTIGKLDAATRAEAMARTETVRIEDEKGDLKSEIAELEARCLLQEDKLRELASFRQEVTVSKGAVEEREQELLELRTVAKERELAYSATQADLRERIETLELERERIARQATDIRHERDAALANVETLTHRLKGLESSDEERLKAQRERIESLSNDLTEALDMATRNETDLVAANRELAKLRTRVADLTATVEQLQSIDASMGSANGTGISEDDRRELARQLDAAIELIDRQLAHE